MKSFPLLLTTSLLLIISCNQKKEQNSSVAEQAPQPEQYVRPAAKGGNSAAYFSYQNELDVADTLLSVQAADVGMVQVHETYEAEGGMMGMREIKELTLQPDKKVVFKQGGMHIMLMNVQHKLQPGDSLKVEIEWSQAGAVTQTLPVIQ